MRRLGLILGLAACTPAPGGADSSQSSTSGEASTTSGADEGVHTVTGWDTSTPDPSEPSTSVPAPSETSSDVTTTNATTDVDTGTSSETGETDATTTGISKTCGNGVVEADEQCDDGNQDNTDNCTVKCAPPSCGDGLIHPANEACDDGNDAADDACLPSCVAASCGDGEVWGGMEDCDDGNNVNSDGCLATCKAAKCGDGFVWIGKEICDDGFNDDTYNSCKPGCQAHASARCGDGVIQDEYQEHCDGPTGMIGVACSMCRFDFSLVPQMSCSNSCSYDASPGCGQGDADIFCKLRTGNASATAKPGWTTVPPTDQGGFACSDPDVWFPMDLRKWLGALPEFGVNIDVPWQANKIKSTHGTSNVLSAGSVQCNG